MLSKGLGDMACARTEQWCDSELQEAHNVMQYLRLRDEAILARVCEAQRTARERTEAAQLIMKDFSNLLRCAVQHQTFLLDSAPSQRNALSKQPSLHTPNIPARAHEPEHIPRTSPMTLEDVVRDVLLPLPKSSTSTNTMKMPPLRDTAHVPVARIHTINQHQEAPKRVAPRSSSAAIHKAVTPAKTTSPRQPPRRTRQTMVAKELSEARIKVLRRRKIIAERRKNVEKPAQRSSVGPNYRNGSFRDTATNTLQKNNSRGARDGHSNQLLYGNSQLPVTLGPLAGSNHRRGHQRPQSLQRSFTAVPGLRNHTVSAQQPASVLPTSKPPSLSTSTSVRKPQGNGPNEAPSLVHAVPLRTGISAASGTHRQSFSRRLSRPLDIIHET